jgi:hypothetical protein
VTNSSIAAFGLEPFPAITDGDLLADAITSSTAGDSSSTAVFGAGEGFGLIASVAAAAGSVGWSRTWTNAIRRFQGRVPVRAGPKLGRVEFAALQRWGRRAVRAGCSGGTS